MDAEIVITGIGTVCGSGTGCQPFWESIHAGQSGIRPLEVANVGTLPFTYGGEVVDFQPKLYMPRKNIKLMCREVQLAVAAAHLAMDHAGFGSDIDRSRLGVVYGSEMFYARPKGLVDLYRVSSNEGEFDIQTFGEKFTSEMNPLWMLKYLPNMPACHIGICQDARGPNNTIVQGDASGLLAIIEAISVINRGWADVMIAGGVGTAMNVTRCVQLKQPWSTQPDHRVACRPFDKQRDGMVVGEGSSSLILETRAHAEARGAIILGKVSGFGRVFEIAQPLDREIENGPSEDSIRRAIRNALEDAGCSSDDVDHVNAYGLSTVKSDAREAQAIRAELGDVPVLAAKSYFGQMGAGGGPTELAASVLALHYGVVPRTLNYEQADDACPVNVIRDQPKPMEKSAVLKLSLSSTGQAAALVVQKHAA